MVTHWALRWAKVKIQVGQDGVAHINGWEIQGWGASLKGGQAWGTALFPWAFPNFVLYGNPYLLGTVVDADMTLY